MSGFGSGFQELEANKRKHELLAIGGQALAGGSVQHCGTGVVVTSSRKPLATRDPWAAALLLRSSRDPSELRLFGGDVLSERGRARGWAEPAAACDSAGSATPPRAPAPPAPPGASFRARAAPRLHWPSGLRARRCGFFYFFPLPSAARPSLPGSSGASGHAGSSPRASFPLRPDRVAETWCTRQQPWNQIAGDIPVLHKRERRHLCTLLSASKDY